MPRWHDYAPETITQAARDPLGIFALAVVALSAFGVIFFRKALGWIRIAVFVLMVGGFAGFAAVSYTYLPPETGGPEEIQEESGDARVETVTETTQVEVR